MIGMVEQNRDWLPANRDYREELEAASALSDLDSQFVIPACAGMTRNRGLEVCPCDSQKIL
jgi:hypothetical protein